MMLVMALLVVSVGSAQQAQSGDELVITTKELRAAGLWRSYSIRLQATGEVLKWRLAGGSLPRDLRLHDFGQIEGVVNEQGMFNPILEVTGQNGQRSKPKMYRLEIEQPLKTEWSRKSQVNGNRIEGSIKVTNTTGRDFDLTFDVLAVNEIGRATAIGYQRFTLKSNTREMELPFGDTLAPGSYDVNIDVVAEEPQSKMIFRGRLVAPKQTITPVL
jgi:hypothetical protein